MDLPDHEHEGVRTEVWRSRSMNLPAVIVEVSEVADNISALVDRAALAIVDSLDVGPPPSSMDDLLYAAYEAVESSLFRVPSIWDGQPNEEFKSLFPIPMHHDGIWVDYGLEAITVYRCPMSLGRGVFNPVLHQAEDLVRRTAPEPSDLLTVVRALAQSHLRHDVLLHAHQLSRGGFTDHRNAPRFEAETLASWGIGPRELDVKSWVYFVRRGETGPIKIGWSKSPAARIAQLQTGQDVKLSLLATAPGGCREESALHARFSASRLMGEWFRATPWLVGYIRKVSSTGVL